GHGADGRADLPRIPPQQQRREIALDGELDAFRALGAIAQPADGGSLTDADDAVVADHLHQDQRRGAHGGHRQAVRADGGQLHPDGARLPYGDRAAGPSDGTLAHDRKSTTAWPKASGCSTFERCAAWSSTRLGGLGMGPSSSAASRWVVEGSSRPTISRVGTRMSWASGRRSMSRMAAQQPM